MQPVEIMESRLDFTQLCARVARCLRHEMPRGVIGARSEVVNILACSGDVSSNEVPLEFCQRFFDGRGDHRCFLQSVCRRRARTCSGISSDHAKTGSAHGCADGSESNWCCETVPMCARFSSSRRGPHGFPFARRQDEGLEHFSVHGWMRVRAAFTAHEAAAMRTAIWRELAAAGITERDPRRRLEQRSPAAIPPERWHRPAGDVVSSRRDEGIASGVIQSPRNATIGGTRTARDTGIALASPPTARNTSVPSSSVRKSYGLTP